MTDLSKPLAGQRILISNDDGIHAPGLKVLEEVARQLSDDVWVVAPETEQSAASHALTIRRPVFVRRLGAQRYSVDGTPTDCVVVAVNKILADKKPDLVLSGVNHGGNMAEDVGYSGTVAVAMEATLLGVRAFALSQVRRPEGNTDFAPVKVYAAGLIQLLASQDWPADTLMNINFPPLTAEQVKGVKVGSQGRRAAQVQLVEGKAPSGRPYVWIGDFADHQSPNTGTDLSLIYSGHISVTPLHLDLTHKGMLGELEELLG